MKFFRQLAGAPLEKYKAWPRIPRKYMISRIVQGVGRVVP
jgi:hypothetical protein